MPLVFVHGIGNRWDDDYQQRSDERDRLFETFIFPVLRARSGSDVVRSPFWGDFGGTLRWSGSSFPRGGMEALGAGADDPQLVDEIAAVESEGDPDRVLVKVARRDLADAVDLLFSIAPPAGDGHGTMVVAAADRLVAYCRARAEALPDGDVLARHPWLATVEDDDDLVDQVWDRSAGWRLDADGRPQHTGDAAERESLGGASGDGHGWLAGGVRRLRRAAIGQPMNAAMHTVRAVVGRRAAALVGDVAIYLNTRGERAEPGRIVQQVAAAIDEAAKERDDRHPLVVVAHSLGGIIAYDLLSYYRPDLVVDVLVTVGSQVGLFEELTLLRTSDPALPSVEHPRVDVAGNIRSWINVVDRADILAFRAEPIFRRVRDYVYPSAAVWAHGAYLRQPHFHARLADRLREAIP